jgi:hypothetical protein
VAKQAFSGLGLINTLTVVVGLILAGVGLWLGALNNMVLGSMVVILVGIGLIASALISKEEA